MLAVKCHVAVTILATFVSSLIWGTVPYFPIEISRTASSGPVPTLIFRTGCSLLLGTIWATNLLNASTLLMWVGLVIVAQFTDVEHLVPHLAGVALVFAGAASMSSVSKGLAPLLTAAVIFAIRLPLKVGALVLLEFGWPSPWYMILSPSFVLAVRDKAMAVMYQGPEIACKHYPQSIESIFQITAVLQWVSFYALSHCV